MAKPTSENEVTVRRLSDVIVGVWDKVKANTVSDVAWDSTNSKLTKTKNGETSDVVTKSTLLSALGGSIADGNTGFVTGDAAYDALALKANLASPSFTGTPTAPTATAGTNTTQIATTAFVKTAVDNAIATADALTYKGTVDGGSTGSYGALTPAASKGDVYKVSAAGKIDGVKVEVGDMLVCNADSTAAATSSNYSTIVANWDFIQSNIDGAVTSSASSVTANTVAIFDGTTGKIIKSSGYTIGKSVPSNAVFTDASVTAVGNHYAPTTDSSAEKDASGGTATQLPTSSGSSNVQVVTGITMDAKGHVTGVVSKGLYSHDTTYESKSPVSGGTTESLCTTGEKYTWNNKQDLISDLATIRAQAGGAVRYDASQDLTSDQKTQARSNIGAGTSDLTIGTTGSTAAAGNHTHTTSLASDTGSSAITLSSGGKYKLTAGGNSVIFTMPADTKVKATEKTNNADYKILALASTSPTSGVADEAVYDTNITLNPSTNTITANLSGNATTATTATNYSTSGGIATALASKAASSHTHGNIDNAGTLTDTAAAAAGSDYVVIRDADTAKIQTSTIKGTDVADAVSKKHSHSTLTLSTTAQAYDGTHTLALPSTDPYTSARTPASHTHGNITNGGALQTDDITIADGDKLVVTDASDSNKVARTSIAFDGSTTSKALTPKGTFETFLTSHQSITTGSSNGTIAVDGTDVAVYGLGSAAYTESTDYATSNHTHTASIATDSTSGSVVSLSANTQYKLTAGGSSVRFKTPANPTVNNGALKIGLNGGTATSKFTANQSTDSTLTFATGSANGTISVDGTDVAVKGLGSAAYTASTAYATSGHTHATSIAASSGTNQITLSASTKYAITAGGTSYVFTTPPNTTYSSKTAASGGTDVSLCTTGEKYIWNNKQDALTEMTETEVQDLLAVLT